jgi:hypothetical protein
MVGIRYIGIIQAGYRKVLQTLFTDEMTHSTVTPPATELPSTPTSRNVSFGTLPLTGHIGRDHTPKPDTPLSDNKFMSVPLDHVPASPTHKPRSKRGRDASAGIEAGPSKKPKAN